MDYLTDKVVLVWTKFQEVRTDTVYVIRKRTPQHHGEPLPISNEEKETSESAVDCYGRYVTIRNIRYKPLSNAPWDPLPPYRIGNLVEHRGIFFRAKVEPG
jgi:hypothetical protein